MERVLWRRETTNFVVTLTADYDDSTDPLAHMERDLADEVYAKLSSGEYGNYVMTARVLGPDGYELASDSLYGCIYADPADFIDHRAAGRERRATGHNVGSYFTDMVHNVCTAARKEVNKPRPRLRVAA